MKTIQEIICNTDPKEIEFNFYYTYPIKLWELNTMENISIHDLNQRISNNFQRCLNYLKTLKAEPTKDKFILYAFKSLDNDNPTMNCEIGLVNAKELKEAEDINSVADYSYRNVSPKEALSFYIADNYMTQNNIIEVIIDFLYELSCNDPYKKQKAAIDNINNEQDENLREDEKIDINAFLDNIQIDSDITYPEESILLDTYYESVNQYIQYCRYIELKILQSKMK